jgi:hypothetical protein
MTQFSPLSQQGFSKIITGAMHQWLVPIVLTTWEVEIRRIEVQSQLRQIVHKTLSSK